jgi:hypothetical protein
MSEKKNREHEGRGVSGNSRRMRQTKHSLLMGRLRFDRDSAVDAFPLN